MFLLFYPASYLGLHLSRQLRAKSAQIKEIEDFIHIFLTLYIYDHISS